MIRSRRVDWSELGFSGAVQSKVPAGTLSSELASLLSALDELVAFDDVSRMLKHAVEIARERIQLARVGIFLRDEPNGVMRGTWGTDLRGVTVDEGYITFAIWEGDKASQEKDRRAGIYWRTFEDAPLVVHTPEETKVVGRAWVCCTPIHSNAGILGMMFNDAGLSGAPLDDAKQSRVAVFCSLVGTALDLVRHRQPQSGTVASAAQSRTVARALQLLSKNPALRAEQLGAELRLSASRIARVFKSEIGMSLVEYRNRLRLERFSMLLDQEAENLQDAALESGFGSYAQFHRVFLAQHGVTPGAFARARRQK